MERTIIFPLATLAASALVACAGVHGSNGAPQQFAPIPLGDGLAITGALLPRDTIGAGFPPQVGKVFSKKWKADVAGFTQTHYSQVLGFPPGTKITITNISKGSIYHTLNVIAKRAGPPAKFPTNLKLLTSRSGGDKLVPGFRSGILTPGAHLRVTLVEGNYLIGCAFHYKTNGMRDVLVVAEGAKPGPTATPP